MKAHFVREACSIEELKSVVGKSIGEEYLVEQTVELAPQAYADFSQDMLADYSFLAEHVTLMYVDTNQVWHCVLVKSKGGTSGTLVQAEGFHYARYSAYLERC